MRKLLEAWTKLVGGNAANGVLQLIIFAVAAQALELAQLGILILIQSYVRVIDGLLNFQSVNVLTNYLAEAQNRGNDSRVRGLVKAGLLVDFGTALIATLVAIVGLQILAPVIGIPQDWIWLASAYCLVITTRSFGAVEAALRCFDRFGAISLRPVTVSIVVLLGSLGAWALNGNAEDFLIVWLVGEAFANVVFLFWAIISLRGNGLRGLLSAKAREAIDASQGFWPTMWQTNFTFGLRILSQEGDILVVGAFLGESAAALLRAAKNLAVLVGQFGMPLHKAASVPISRFVADGENARAYGFALKSSLGVAVASVLVTLIMVVATPMILSLAFGEEFTAAYWIVLGLLVAKTLYLAGAALPPLMIALDITKQFTAMIAVGNIVFFGVLFALVGPAGLIAAVFAHIAFELVWALYGWIVTGREVRRREDSNDALGAA